MGKGDVQQKKVDAPWRRFTKTEEDQRLDTLDGRIARRKWLIAIDQEERRRIMFRAVRRMRRAEGKE